MSTTPGDSTWTDSGLIPLDDVDPADLEPIDDATDADELEQATPASTAPVEGDPVQLAEGSEGDVLDQRHAVPDDGSDDYPA